MVYNYRHAQAIDVTLNKLKLNLPTPTIVLDEHNLLSIPGQNGESSKICSQLQSCSAYRARAIHFIFCI